MSADGRSTGADIKSGWVEGGHLYTAMPGLAEMGYLSVIGRHQIHGFHREGGPGRSGPSLRTRPTSDAQIFSLQDNIVGLGFAARCNWYLIGQHMVHMFHHGAGPGRCLPAVCTRPTPDTQTFSVHDNIVGLGSAAVCWCDIIGRHQVHMFHHGAGPGRLWPL